MGRPSKRSHGKSASPTWDFSLKRRPADDTEAERAEKDRLVREYLEKKNGADNG